MASEKGEEKKEGMRGGGGGGKEGRMKDMNMLHA
jgi:hypothetical protein